MRTRRLHARLAYVKRADDRASVAFAAASTFVHVRRGLRAYRTPKRKLQSWLAARQRVLFCEKMNLDPMNIDP